MTENFIICAHDFTILTILFYFFLHGTIVVSILFLQYRGWPTDVYGGGGGGGRMFKYASSLRVLTPPSVPLLVICGKGSQDVFSFLCVLLLLTLSSLSSILAGIVF